MMWMIRVKTIFTILTFLMLIAPTSALDWTKVEEAKKKGLPKTAIKELEPLLKEAIEHKLYDEAIRALATKISLGGQIQGNKSEELLTRLKKEMGQAPEAMQPLLKLIYANWTWNYFQENRWQFRNRTQTDTEPGPDITTWDLKRILLEIDVRFTDALEHEEDLKKIPVEQYSKVLLKGHLPDNYRPTLFDFIAHEALKFYQAGEQGIRKAENYFEITSESPIFLPANDFLKWEPKAENKHQPSLQAIKLFQKLLSFHLDDQDPTAFIDADFLRLKFGNNYAVGEDKTEQYQKALERFVKKWPHHEVSSKALYQLANISKGKGDLVEALELAQRGHKAFPKSIGGRDCEYLAFTIQQPKVSISTEKVWNNPWPNIKINYKNITKAYFKAIPYDYKKLISKSRWGRVDRRIDSNLSRELQQLKAIHTWSVDLKETDDYQERSELSPAPKTLKPGYYFILSSHNETFEHENNAINAVGVWVSDLALITENRSSENLKGLVLNSLSGEPMQDATVQLYRQTNKGFFSIVEESSTNQNGLFSFPISENKSRNHWYFIQKGEHALSNLNEIYHYQRSKNRPISQTIFYTDRSIYRPGQTIQFKGVCYKVDEEKKQYDILANQDLTIVFRDANSQEIAKLKTKSNDFGSFSGSFTAPGGTMTGYMSIRVQNGPKGNTSINVEEYKRPKFHVNFDPLKDSVKLYENVNVIGHAKAYTGAAINHTKVTWRVQRDIQFPAWCWWGWNSYSTQPGQNIAHGTTETDHLGQFKISFKALPDLAVPAKNEPIFTYVVHADVTDSTGETRSSTTRVRVGYTSLKADLNANEWQTVDREVIWTINTTNLNNQPQASSGNLKLYSLISPDKVTRKQLNIDHYSNWRGSYLEQNNDDPSDSRSWKLGKLITSESFNCDGSGKIDFKQQLPEGPYRLLLECRDHEGKLVTAQHTLQVVNPKSDQYELPLPHYFNARKWQGEVGETFTALWGTGYKTGRAYIQIEKDKKTLSNYWTSPSKTQELIEVPITEELRGGFTIKITFVRENRAYLLNKVIHVPWSNKQLSLKWESFRSKLTPGEKETWTAIISGPDAEQVTAEMVATLYDASLDQYKSHHWRSSLYNFRSEYSHLQSSFNNAVVSFRNLVVQWPRFGRTSRGAPYRYFHHDIRNSFRYDRPQISMMYMKRSEIAPQQVFAQEKLEVEELQDEELLAEADIAFDTNDIGLASLYNDGIAFGGAASPRQNNSKPDLDQVKLRTNLNETAFFLPHLTSKNGEIRMQFTMPEALTEWKFMGLAHDKHLRSAYLEGKTVTSKDLMVEPNPPRFVREGDQIEFTVKVSNQSATLQQGQVRLSFKDARTLNQRDDILGNSDNEKNFSLAAKQSKSFSWRIKIPDDLEHLIYKAVGASDRLSDGEEGYLPVLSKRILVQESLPLPIRGKQVKNFTFDKLLESKNSSTLKHQNLTVQMVSQPAWYAIMALPYLMEYPHECSEQVYSRFYANALAQNIATSQPKIRHIFNQWKNTKALDSPLEKNQTFKSIALEETPWVQQAQNESQARRRVGHLFDENKLVDEQKRAFHKLAQMQLDNGLWPWFSGFRPDEMMSLTIVTGFGRLRHLGVKDVDLSLALKALPALDQWMYTRYQKIQERKHPENYTLTSIDALYLYGRSFFIEDKEVSNKHQVALNFFLKQGKKDWLSIGSRLSKGHFAIAALRFGDSKTAKDIMKSVKEFAVHDQELGMYWRDTERSWWWYRAPIETQALMIEAFDEVMNDQKAVEDCKVWLLKQKQTQDWKTTRATADAIYALLLRGQNLLSSDALVEVSLGGSRLKPKNVEAGTGFYEKSFLRNEIQPKMGKIEVKKTDEGVSWGSVHWNYLEDISKITPATGTPLKLSKKLYHKVNSSNGPILKDIEGPLKVGDELVCRIELRTDRDMEYIHLKDQRGSGTEPTNVLTQYRYQDGLGYIESTRDTASHFYISYLPKGVYIFEYSVRVQLKGSYESGLASIECMYAPEFKSHSESILIKCE